MQKGKQKLVLDHLIVQKMDDDEPGGNDLQSILTYGAKALFDEEGEEKEDRGIHCTCHLYLSFQDLTYRADSEADVKNLIERTEQATDEEGEAEGKTGDFSFSFAKVWTSTSCPRRTRLPRALRTTRTRSRRCSRSSRSRRPRQKLRRQQAAAPAAGPRAQ
jgi:hypothetical protein